MRRYVACAVLAVVLAGCPVASASAGQVITDCNSHGQLTRSYSTGELRSALASLPADVKEYTNCYDVIQRALLAQVGSAGHRGSGSGSASSGGSGGSFLSTPVIAVLVLLALLGGGLSVAAARRRRRADQAG